MLQYDQESMDSARDAGQATTRGAGLTGLGLGRNRPTPRMPLALLKRGTPLLISRFNRGTQLLLQCVKSREHRYGQRFCLGSGLLLFGFTGKRAGKLRSI